MKPIDKETMVKMLDDWQSGKQWMDFCNEYGLSESAYKIFCKEAKSRGLVRSKAKDIKSSLLEVMDIVLKEQNNVLEEQNNVLEEEQNNIE